jgi:O-antigen/teichoic acid export membrane protein
VIVQLILGTLTMLLAIATVAHMRIVERLWVSVRLGRRFLAFGGKVWVGGLSQTANVRLDQALLSGLFPAATLGLYVTATSVSGLLFVLATSVALIVTPSVANKTGQAAKRHELQRMFRKFWIMNIACAVALAAVSPLAIPLLFGEEFRGAILPALILTAGAVFLGAKEILAGAAQSLGDPWLGSRAEIAGMIAAAVLMLALLPPFGLIGAAIATAMAYLVQFAVLVRGLGTRHDIRAAALFGGRALDPVAAENRSDRGSAN